MKVSPHALYITNKNRYIGSYDCEFCVFWFHLFISVTLLSEHVAMVKECRVKNMEFQLLEELDWPVSVHRSAPLFRWLLEVLRHYREKVIQDIYWGQFPQYWLSL